MDTEQNKAAVRELDEITANGDLHKLDQLCTPDMVNHALASHRAPGLAGTKEYLGARHRDPESARWMRAMIGDQLLTVVAEDDLVVQYGVRHGTWPGGRFLGFDAPSGPYRTDVAFMYRLSDGRIAERWALRDDLGMLLQLGAIAVPELERR